MQNKYNRYKRLGVAFLLLLTALLPAVVKADDVPQAQPLTGKKKSAAVDSIVAGYSNWGRVALSGKLRCSMLPLAATVKVYMEKDKMLLMSVSAPFVGEAGRVEIVGDTLLIVNKMKRKYATVALSEVQQVYPGALSDIQHLFLGRATLFGHGTLGRANASDVNIIDDGSPVWAIIPDEKIAYPDVVYAYAYDRLIERLSQLVVYVGADDNLIDVNYTWSGSQLSELALSATIRFNNRAYDGTLSFGAPEWGAKAMKRIEIDGRYQQVGFREVLKF